VPSPTPLTDDRLPLLMSLNGGYVDTLGFIALHGLFSAHVTGNFVTIGYALANGASGAWTKLAALPVFCLGVFAARLYGQARREANKPVFMQLLSAKTLLLCLAAALALTLGPFPAADSWGLFATGMALVLAMSIQNAVHRVHLGSAPPSTLMTGTTTQIMLDLADAARGEADEASRKRMARMGRAVLAFAAGCAAAALVYMACGMWGFIVPPLVSLAGQGLAGRYPA
jgi:uncharacterized membrane protein YoaK (UPF0700 family)